ncbi:hypothetical protein FQA39_LY12364 [Lamprigera yunnana]|nr:hypothetical protein FQA39_LY12364 [Lamprigera yunnana]
MKVLTLIFIIFGFASANKLPSDIIEIWNMLVTDENDDCIVNTNVDPIKIKAIFIEAKIPYEENILCYIKCVYEKMNFLLPNGDFNINELLNKAPYLTQESVENCKKIANPETDVCRKSYLFAHCVIESLIKQ